MTPPLPPRARLIPSPPPLGFYLLRLFRRRHHPTPSPLSSPLSSLLARFPRSLAPSSLLVQRPYPSSPWHRSPFPMPFYLRMVKVPQGYGPPPQVRQDFSFSCYGQFLLYLHCPASIRRLLLSHLLQPWFSFPSSRRLHHLLLSPNHAPPSRKEERRRLTRFAFDTALLFGFTPLYVRSFHLSVKSP